MTVLAALETTPRGTPGVAAVSAPIASPNADAAVITPHPSRQPAGSNNVSLSPTCA
jgi:hypothetical protein